MHDIECTCWACWRKDWGQALATWFCILLMIAVPAGMLLLAIKLLGG